MQVKNEFALLARDVSIDANDNMMSLFKIINSVTFSDIDMKSFDEFKRVHKDQAILLPVSINLATSWKLNDPLDEDMPIKIVIKFINPTGAIEGTQEVPSFITKGNARMRYNIAINDIPVQQNGQHKLEVQMIDDANNKTLSIAEAFLDVFFAPKSDKSH